MSLLPEGVAWLEAVNWNDDGLIAAIAQEVGSGRVLTLAWMNREALTETARSQRAVYWSRSRGKLWRKGEQSGHVQEVQSIRLDCDADAIVMLVKQVSGIACHTGRHSCFYRELSAEGWQDKDPVIKDPAAIYSS